MKHLVILKQKGTGCDYTIGCGIATEIVDFDTELELFNHINDEWGDCDDFEYIKYVPLEQVVNLNSNKLQEEYTQYLELKKKFEKEGDLK